MHGGTPETRYARSGELSIAYQVVGDGDIDIVYVPGWVSHVELQWEPSPASGLVEGLARIGRLITFDKRGTGLSDRSLGVGTLEDRMDDVRAVMDAAGVERAALVGISEGGPMSILFAASHPARVQSLVLLASFARPVSGPDYPHGFPPEVARAYAAGIPELWGTGVLLSANAPDPPDGLDAVGAAARYERNSSTPGVARAIMDANIDIDVRHVLPTITAPTLVLHCRDDPFIPVGHSRYLGEHIPGARYVEIDGDFHVSWRPERYAPMLEEIEQFLTGAVVEREADRVLKTVLFTDIVDSTATAGRLGDARWREVLDAHDRIVRRELERYRGTEVNTTGDGFLAAFDGPARAIRCAHAIVDAVAATGVRVRAGLHAGECEVRGDDLAGMAVHIGARVAGLAGAGEVVVSSTVRDLVAGSGLGFDDLGEHELKGVPDRWRLLRALPA
jgi:class 3 adenylate cyclase